MKLLAGTSGYAFKEWKGNFYPSDLKDDGMLGYYAGKFPTVEINNTFYRLPKEHVLLDWASQVPEPFTFAIKASQRITHHARIGPDCVDAVEFLMRNIGALGGRLGPVLFQLPPNLKKDLVRLRVFLDTLPLGGRFTIELRAGTRTTCSRCCARGTSPCASPTSPSSRRPSSRRRRGDTRGCTSRATTRRR